MHKHIFNLILSLAFLAGSKQLVAADSKVVALSIYIVSETKIEGGRYINTPECPKAGFIPATPAMVVEKLESVEQSHSNKALMIKMFSADAKKFETLTEKNVGKKALITLGDTPITAPTIIAPISTPGFMLTYGKLDKKKFEEDLRKLVK
jgi:hypothetical protein